MNPAPDSPVQNGPSRKIRLTFVVETNTDVRLVEGLAERFDLTVVGRSVSDAGVSVSQPLTRPVEMVAGPRPRIAFSRFLWRRFRANQEATEFVLVQGYGLIALAVNLACRFARVPVAMLICSPTELYYACRKSAAMPDKPYRFREFLALKLIARVNARLGSMYIALSEHLADVVRSHGYRGSIEIIPLYGVDTRVFHPSNQSRERLRVARGLPADGNLLFFSSRIAPEKDAKTLLEAMKLLLAKGRHIRLLHRSGGYRQFLEAAARFDLLKYVIATDAAHPTNELPMDYQACELCVQSSRAEGLGFSPLEAMACGAAVIASAVGGLRETVIDGETGWSFAPGDAAALARCIEDALDRPVEAARRGANAQAMVKQQFEREVVLDKLQALVERVVNCN